MLAWRKSGKNADFQGFFCIGTTDVVRTLEALQKTINIHDNKGMDILKLGCTLTIHANKCPHNSTSAKLCTFTESDKDLLEEPCEDMVDGPSIMFYK